MGSLFKTPKVPEQPKPITRDEVMIGLEDRVRLARRRGRSENVLAGRRRDGSQSGAGVATGGSSVTASAGAMGGGNYGAGGGGAAGGGRVVQK